MSDLAHAYDQTQAELDRQAAKRERTARAYQAVFDNTPEPTFLDRKIVNEDLADFCGMRTAMMAPGASFAEVAERAGMFRVLQRIHAFRFPRPTDAITPGGKDDRLDQSGPGSPIAGGGVAERTDD